MGVNAGHQDIKIIKDTVPAVKISLMDVVSLVFRKVTMCGPKLFKVQAARPLRSLCKVTSLCSFGAGFSHTYNTCATELVGNGFPIILLQKPLYLWEYSSVMEIEFNFILGPNAQFSLSLYNGLM